MTMDPGTVEKIIEIIAREVLIAIEEDRYRKENPDGSYCSYECADGICVTTCFDKAGEVINAGADRLTSTLGNIPKDLNVAKTIDHTLLKPEATADQVAQLCYEAKTHHFASVCINPTHVKLCAELLKGSDVKVCTVIGFPLGASATEVKVFETQVALRNGATEIDMVINIGALKAKDLDLVAKDIRAVVSTGHAAGALVKTIIETSLLTDEEKVMVCLIAKEAGADFVKTSTGFSSGGATVADVMLMKRTVGPTVGVKASGGVRTREDALSMIKAGATRIGASAGVKIIQADSKPEPSSGGAPKSY